MKFTFFLLALSNLALAAPLKPEVRTMLENTYQAGGKIIKQEVFSNSAACQVTDLVIAAADPLKQTAGVEIQVRLFSPTNATELPVLLMPPTGGMNSLDIGTAESLCANQHPVAILKGFNGDQEMNVDWNIHNNYGIRSLNASRNTLDALNWNKVGLIGTSLGSINGSISTSIDSRIVSAILIVGGGPLNRVIAHSDQEILVKLKNDRMKAFQIRDDAEYEAILKEKIFADPAAVADAAAGKKIWFVMGDRDTTVPTVNQQSLYELWGSPKLTTFSGNHLWAIWRMHTFYRSEMHQFFAQ